MIVTQISEHIVLPAMINAKFRCIVVAQFSSSILERWWEKVW